MQNKILLMITIARSSDQELITVQYVNLSITRPNYDFLHVLSYQTMTFPHISYSYLAEDRAKFYANK